MTKVINLLDQLSPEEVAQLVETDTSGGMPVDNEWMILAEWLQIAGYQAYLDAKNDAVDENGKLKITLQEILTLIEATRKLNAFKQFKDAEATLYGTYSANSREPTKTFDKVTKHIKDRTKVEE